MLFRSVTPPLAGSLATVAVKSALPATSTVAVDGVIVTASAGPDMLSVVLELRDGSVSEVAVMVTVPFVGIASGAV